MGIYYTTMTRETMRNEFRDAHNMGQVLEKVTSCNTWAKIMVMSLTGMGIPFKVVPMGAGVKKVTTDVQICPKCKGLGKC